MSDKDNERAKDQAKAQFESIKAMVERLQHCQECTGGEACELSNEEIFEGLGEYHGDREASEEDREQYHDEDAARDAIQEDPLEVKIRSDWQDLGETFMAEEFMILLCTGGPAVRMTGGLDAHKQPDSAVLEYQDWFTQWEEYPLTYAEREFLLAYAREFYFEG